MVEERAVVLAVFGEHDEFARVKTQRQSTCSACEMKSGCGQHLVSKIVGGKGLEIELENRLSARPGDVVMLSIPEQGVLKASALMFLLPLLIMLASALLVSNLFNASDAIVAIAGLAGLGLGMLWVRHLAKQLEQDPTFKPRMSAIALVSTVEAACHK